MEKQGYINARAIYRMEWQDAERYWGADSSTRRTYKLDDASLRRLLALTAHLAKSRPSTQHRPDNVRSNPVLTWQKLVSRAVGEARTDEYSSLFRDQHYAYQIESGASQSTVEESVFETSPSSAAEETRPLLARHEVSNPSTAPQQQGHSITGWIWRSLLWLGAKSMALMKWFGVKVAKIAFA